MSSMNDPTTKAAIMGASGRAPVSGSNVVSMAILFGMVKRQVQAQQAMEQQSAAYREEGGRAQFREHAAREQNLDRMRQQTKSQLALSMGVDPYLMSGGSGMGDPTTAAYITRASASQQKRSPYQMGLGMI